MDLLPVKMSFGEQGFLSWLIPLVVLLCGVLTWISPAQRAFYGIIGAVTSLAGVIALNLGGFFVGMLFGLVGGALAVAWTPGATATPPPPPPAPAPPDGSLEELFDGRDAQTTDVLPTGPLTDQLPTAQKSPLGTPPVQGSPVQGGPMQGGPMQGGPIESGGRHAANRPEPPRTLLLVLLAAAVTTALLALPRAPDALAAPCTPAPPPPPAPAPSASASPSPSPTGGGGNAVGNFFDGLGRLLGLGPKKAADPPAPAPAPSASSTKPAPAPSCPSSGGGTSKPKPKPGSGTGAKRLAVPAGQPMVNQVASTQLSALLVQTFVTFDGVVDLPVQGGTLRALQFSLASATSTPFELRVPVGNQTLSIKSSKLSVTGHVKFFATRVQGLIGVKIGDIPIGIRVDFTPEKPPPLVPPFIFFTDAEVQLAFVQADSLSAPNLSISYL
jgi:hypothetical protein